MDTKNTRNKTMEVGSQIQPIAAGDGANVFTFNAGDGYKKINATTTMRRRKPGSSRPADTLKFGSGITREMLAFERDGDNLKVTVGGKNSRDRVTVMQDSTVEYPPAIDHIAVDGYYLSLDSVFVSPQNPIWLKEGSILTTKNHPASKVITDMTPVADNTQKNDEILRGSAVQIKGGFNSERNFTYVKINTGSPVPKKTANMPEVFTFNAGDGYKKINTKIIGPGKSRSADTPEIW